MGSVFDEEDRMNIRERVRKRQEEDDKEQQTRIFYARQKTLDQQVRDHIEKKMKES